MGGGGGGGRGLTPEQVQNLERIAKERMTQPDGSPKCNAFISFVEEDLNEVNLLRGQAKNENSDIEFNDWSVKKPYDSKEAEYIKRGIRERIRQCSTVIVYLSDQTAASKWVDWEIREAKSMGKNVVGMYSKSPPATLPAAITEFKIPLVPWNQEKLSEAIKQKPK